MFLFSRRRRHTRWSVTGVSRVLFRSRPVSLPAARAVLFFKTFDPLIFEQAAQRAVQGAGAQPNAPLAHPLGVLEDRVAVARLFRQAEKDQQDRLGNVHMSSNDMSSTAILPDP